MRPAMLVAAGALILVTVMLWPYWPPALLGVVLAASVLIERRYRSGGFALRPPADAPGWQPTGEKFIEPESGRMLQVWYHPATGQRDYREVAP